LIVVDTSTLFAIVAGEARGPACAEALAAETDIMISAATLAEALIVASRKGLMAEMERLITGAGIQMIPLIEADAMRVADVYNRWARASIRLA
jgi:ribonuclease VapC